jgi:hypothetical protein
MRFLTESFGVPINVVFGHFADGGAGVVATP